jgi:hypothetical protein
VRLETSCGPIVLDRADGTLATLSIQGQPDRAVALKRRDTAELMAEELRRLDPDDTYASALRYGVNRLNTAADAAGAGSSGGTATATKAAPAVKETPADVAERALAKKAAADRAAAE